MVQVGVVRKKDINQSVKTSIKLAGGLKSTKDIQIKSEGINEIESIAGNIHE